MPLNLLALCLECSDIYLAHCLTPSPLQVSMQMSHYQQYFTPHSIENSNLKVFPIQHSLLPVPNLIFVFYIDLYLIQYMF